MRFVLAGLTLGIVLASNPADAQAPAAATHIIGRVTDADTNAPIQGVRVSLMTVTRVPIFAPPAVSVTDDGGRFVFSDVAAGRARFTLQKTGYAFDMMSSPTLDVVANQQNTIDLTLRRGGVLAGRVLDERGEPLTEMRVTAMRHVAGARGGERLMPSLGPSGPSPTNDLGEFRLSGLLAGDYVIVASPMPMAAAGGSTGATAWAPTYFPGVTAQEAAQRITLQPGDTINGLEFRMQSAPAFTVSGVAVDENGQRLSDAMVSLRQMPTAMAGVPTFLNGRVAANGTFVVNGVIPGTYVISANRIIRSGGAGGGFASFSSGIVGIGGVAQNDLRIEVKDADVSGIKVIAPAPRQ